MMAAADGKTDWVKGGNVWGAGGEGTSVCFWGGWLAKEGCAAAAARTAPSRGIETERARAGGFLLKRIRSVT